MKKTYSKPKLVKYDDLKKTWYVYFRYNGRVIKNTGDMNRIHDYDTRLKIGLQLEKILLKKLQEGWNPSVRDVYENFNDEFTFSQALKFSLEKKKPHINHITYKCYACTERFIKKAVLELGLENLLVTETKRAHIKAILEQIKHSRNWSGKAYNKALGHIQVLCNEMIQWDLIPYSPATGLKKLAIMDERANVPPTDKEYRMIIDFLKEKCPDFCLFVEMIPNTGIRPVELTRIKIKMIDVSRQEIILPAQITKTKTERIVTVNNNVWPRIEAILNKNHDKDYYLFGSFRIPGSGNVGKHNDFIPGPTQIKRDTATRRWEKYIKIELGININLYALKHYGADKMIMSGIDMDVIRNLFGHTSSRMTERYAKAVKNVYRNVILDQFPSI